MQKEQLLRSYSLGMASLNQVLQLIRFFQSPDGLIAQQPIDE